MRQYAQIDSPQNPKVKALVALRQRRERDRSKTFLIEGFRELLRAKEACVNIKSLFICPDLFLGENEGDLIAALEANGAEVFLCSTRVFKKISYRDRPDGLLACAWQFAHSFAQIEQCIDDKKDVLLVLAESIEKPGNLGTILRSSDAVGADAVMVLDRCTDIYNPNVVRASVGTLFTRPVIECAGEEALSWLKKQGITIVSASPSGSKIFTEVDLKGPVAVVLGTEQYGLSQRWQEQAHHLVKIPMRGKADSLNVAMATTLLLYEVLRQRTSA